MSEASIPVSAPAIARSTCSTGSWRQVRRLRSLFVSLAGSAAIVATFGAGQASATTGTATYGTFTLGGSASILAPSNTTTGAVMVGTGCSSTQHQGGTLVSMQIPASETMGVYAYASLLVKNHSNPSWTGAYQVNSGTRYLGYSTINTYQTLINTTWSGAAGNDYDVAVVYWVARPGGSWVQEPVVFENQYALTSAYGNSASWYCRV